MKNSLLKGAFFPFIVVVAIFVSCTTEKDYEKKTTPPMWDGEVSYSPYDIKWDQAADSVSLAFIERFFCSEERQGTYGVFSYREYNYTGQSANFNCYWQQAHAMASMVDYYLRIKDSDPVEEARIREYFRLWYDKRGNNYDGGNAGPSGFGNDFTDDTLWIIIALFQIYDATGDVTYYDAAKLCWDESIEFRFDMTPSGWLPWKLEVGNQGPNECTNGPGAIAAAMLSQYALDAGDEEAAAHYLERAFTCFDQNLAVMESNGTLGSTPLSYTQGTCMEAGRLIWHLTGDEGYIRKAILAARGQMNSSSMNEVYEGEMVMRDEGEDENNSIFHAVLMHWAARMVLDKDIDTVDSSIREELHRYILRHASYYWTRGIDKTEEMWPNSYFGVKCYQARYAGEGGSLGAYTSAAQCIETMYMVQNEF